MKTDQIKITEMTNQRDGVAYVVQINEHGKPLCPHCSEPMERSCGKWENCMCRCWWVGMNDGVYTRQVVFSREALP